MIEPMKVLRVLMLALLAAFAGEKISAQHPPAKANQAVKAASVAGTLIDINRASPAELKSLPGIGDAYSAAIIRNRPYANKAQLVSRKVISESLYQKIKDQIIAKQ